MPRKLPGPRKPKVTARQEGGDDGHCYVVRIDGKVFVTGLTRSEVPHYKQKALEHWESKNQPQTAKPTVPMPDRDKILHVFQRTAQAVGSDMIQAAIDCGEEPECPRDALYDYLDTYGGPDGKEVSNWVMAVSTMEDLEGELDRLGVPKSWR